MGDRTSMADHVANAIHREMKNTAEAVPGLSVRMLHEHTKHLTRCDYPQGKVTLSYVVNHGDVMQPIEFSLVSLMGVTLMLRPSSRIVIYSISTVETAINLTGSAMDAPDKETLRICMLRYDNVTGEIDVKDIAAVYFVGLVSSIEALLKLCKVVDNIASRIA